MTPMTTNLNEPARHCRKPHFDGIVAFVPLQLACLLLFWIKYDWHYLLWLVATFTPLTYLQSSRNFTRFQPSLINQAVSGCREVAFRSETT
jgi:hypothetical protein